MLSHAGHNTSYLDIHSSKGAVAELFDISCLYGKPEFHTIQDHLYEMWLGAADSLTIHKVIEDLGDSQKVLGQHYFIENPDKSKGGLVPKWDFTSASHKGNSEAYIIGAKVGSVSVNKADVDSLSLKSVKGHLADTVYRVDTKAGQPPASVSKRLASGCVFIDGVLNSLASLERIYK